MILRAAIASTHAQPTGFYQWAHEAGLNGMARPEFLEQQGWIKVRQHPFWPLSWLMKKEDE